MTASNPFPRGSIQKILEHLELPQFFKVHQYADTNYLSDTQLIMNLSAEMDFHLPFIENGERIGITAGSRGIDRIAPILRKVCDKIRVVGGIPYIVPCMGSHGVNPTGREAILHSFGITESSMNAEIVNSDELTHIGKTATGLDVYVDTFLLQCDKIIVINRIKPHTAFHGGIESGLLKMMAVGMGKQKGASICHITGFHGMEQRIRAISEKIIGTGRIFMGIALIENSDGKIAVVQAVTGSEIPKTEPMLLEKARALMPSIPYTEADILVVDQMGKDISGSGMDTNVIGRYPLGDIKGNFSADKLVVLSLTEASKGSGHGMGFADFIPYRMFAQIDFEQTYQNGLTNKTLLPAKIPLVMPDDECAIKAALLTCTHIGSEGPKIIRIKNTHELSELYVSEALLGKAKNPVEESQKPLTFSFENGRLV